MIDQIFGRIERFRIYAAGLPVLIAALAQSLLIVEMPKDTSAQCLDAHGFAAAMSVLVGGAAAFLSCPLLPIPAAPSFMSHCRAA
ncbi:hypothetical protein [Methylovirgula sp. HY1]|uniref:hypothetical protein n=1 Tax=Methylovirgula sp. HY1 TaxID=2822761 RepID=UPI001C5B3A01|nr:hypothetical protein [Methylovirgula sp. HY1]